jgi:hypothetical protein
MDCQRNVSNNSGNGIDASGLVPVCWLSLSSGNRLFVVGDEIAFWLELRQWCKLAKRPPEIGRLVLPPFVVAWR